MNFEKYISKGLNKANVMCSLCVVCSINISFLLCQLLFFFTLPDIVLRCRKTLSNYTVRTCTVRFRPFSKFAYATLYIAYLVVHDLILIFFSRCLSFTRFLLFFLLWFYYKNLIYMRVTMGVCIKELHWINSI